MVSLLDASPATSEERTLLVPVPALPSPQETPPEAGELYSELLDALAFLAEAGRPTPCSGEVSECWTSDVAEQQEYAADRCMECPLAEQCRQYALAARETAGVWGGYIPDEARREAVRQAREARLARRRGEYLWPDFRRDFLESGADNPRSEARNGYPTMNAKAPKTSGTCNCGCGDATGPKAMYRPGHDSRHVSSLIAYLENDVADGKKITAREIASLAKQLPSAPLQAKFTRAAQRLAAKVAAKPAEKGGEAA